MKGAALGCLGVVGLLFLVFVAWLLISLPVLEAEISLPESVGVDQEFDLIITHTNPHDDSVILDSIDISDSFLDGFHVVSVTPQPDDEFDLLDMYTWSFSIPVEPEETLVVTYRLKAALPGTWSGDLDVCNPNQDFVTHPLHIMVQGTGIN